MEFLYPAPLSSLESIYGIRDTLIKLSSIFRRSRHRFAWKLRWKGPSMMSFPLDFIYVAIGVAVFAVTALYLNACASL
jgi:hypothetical protein